MTLKLLGFLTDLALIDLLLNLEIILIIIIESKRFGDFISFLTWVENNFEVASIVVFLLLLFNVLIFTVFIPRLIKGTVGQKLYGMRLKPDVNISFINVFLFYITGFILNVVLFPLTIFRAFKRQPLISNKISGLQIIFKEQVNKSLIVFSLFFTVFLIGINFFMYQTNLFFNIGKSLTDYNKLLEYAVEDQNADMLQYFIKEYKSRTTADLSYYECVLSIYQGGINEQICKNALNTEKQNKEHTEKLHELMGYYYFTHDNYKEAEKVLKYFYDNKIINDSLLQYLYILNQQDTSSDKHNFLKKLDAIYKDILKSDNAMIKYKVALMYIDARSFSKATELLKDLYNHMSPKLDKAEVAWYLGETLFLNKKYKDGLKYMKIASDLSSAKYKTMYESYKSYYNSQIKK